METMKNIIVALQIIIRVGVVMRVVMCLIKICVNNEEGGVSENKQKMKNAVIFLIMSECVWVIKDIVFSYYSIETTI